MTGWGVMSCVYGTCGIPVWRHIGQCITAKSRHRRNNDLICLKAMFNPPPPPKKKKKKKKTNVEIFNFKF